MNISELRSFCGSDWDKVNVRIGEALKSDIGLLNTTNGEAVAPSSGLAGSQGLFG